MKYKSLTPELLVEDMPKTVEFYIEVLGFDVKVQVPEKDSFFVILAKDTVEIMLYHRDPFAEEIPTFKTIKMNASVALYLEVEDIESLYTKVKSKVEIIQDMHSTNYGTKEFSIYDCNGYVLMFSER